MQLRAGTHLFSASDLAKHLACRHVTEVDRAKVEDRLDAEPWRDPAVEHLQKRGFDHEEAYVRHLRSQGRQVVDLRDHDARDEGSEARVLEAMQSRAEVIVQAPLAHGHWRGVADLLVRVERASDLGDWSYEVADTKLSSETSGGTILQLSLYSELLARLQGVDPVSIHVVKPGEPFEEESFRLAEYAAYYRRVKRRLEEQAGLPAAKLYERTYPEPCEHCDVCRWWKLCKDKRSEDDHLSLVAGLGSQHALELRHQGRPTLETFADAPEALDTPPRRGHRETYERLHRQARIQLAGRREERDRYELLPPAAGPDGETRGLALLPEPDPGDVWFDIEGDHFFGDGGLEYLFGVSFREDGELRYERWWAHDRAEERAAFEALIDFLVERWERHPGMHVYHFAPYEPAAAKRLMGRHGTRQLEVDRLLRGERFVDLHAVTRQAVRASVESYNLKDLERFAGYTRQIVLREASATRRAIAWALENNDRDGITDAQHDLVEGYNREDCEATEALHVWLEELRGDFVREHGPLERPVLEDGEPGEKKREQLQRLEDAIEALRSRLPEDRATWTEEDEAVELLANLLAYFFREDRCAWWEYFRLADLEPEERLGERKALEGLAFVEDLGTETPRGKSPIHRYRFPAQEFGLKVGEKLMDTDEEEVGSVHAFDTESHTLDVKRTLKTAQAHPTSVFGFLKFHSGSLEDSLLDLASHVAQHGLEGDGAFFAARQLLLRRAPVLPAGESLRRADESALEAARRLVRVIDGGVLAIQGPPGTGKTHTGARMIVDLVRAGKRVGVTANSHKVVRNLVEGALRASRDPDDPGPAIEAFLKTNEGKGDDGLGLSAADNNSKALAALSEGKLVGGTSWLWARDDVVDLGVDVLFVDEAGQLSLATTLAAARCAKNLVLLGDPQQLQQPQQAAHPDGAEIAALEHYLGEHDTMPEDRGLFLELSWRLPPSICAFTSGLYYDDRLQSHPGCAAQELLGESPFTSGLHFVPVEHEGRTSRAPEEVDAIAALVRDLLSRGLRWRDREGAERDLGPEHILVIAPYNAQVGALASALPEGVPAGTVDKFQGQEAPVVVYSTTSSSVEDAPRGMSFLFDPHRMNVATSRAQCVCVLVGSPRLVEVDCKTPRQMKWANGLCAYLDAAASTPPPSGE